MLAVVDVVRMNHSLQVAALFLRSPLKPLVNDDIMKDKIKYAVSKDAQGHGDHIWVVVHLGEVIKQSNRREAEYKCEQVIFFKCMVVYRMVRLVPSP